MREVGGRDAREVECAVEIDVEHGGCGGLVGSVLVSSSFFLVVI